MQAKNFTLSVIVASVISGVGLVSAQIDRQESAVQPVVKAPVRTLVESRDAPLSLASPIDIDPRRMEAPVDAAPPPEPVAQRVAVNNRDGETLGR
ncbi:MAG: hypothetical protein M3O01_07820 [Pseudomonadota bacterium]|nr:hypothetical protein [Pseudomonadota bacterium]